MANRPASRRRKLAHPNLPNALRQRRRPWLRIFSTLFFAVCLLGLIFVWNIGSVLVAPSHHPVASPPPNLHAVPVEFPSASGARIHGWLVAGQTNRGAIILMHGVHSDRRSMIARTEWLSRLGYTVLLFDFQAHGESLGTNITFGFLESRDVTAAVNFVHEKCPGAKIGVIGVSMGAAAALLAEPPLPVDAMVLESSFPTILEATADRMRERFGFFGRLATPLLTCQLKPRLGVALMDLRPIDHAGKITVPKFFIAGAADMLTTAAESHALFAAAAEPKKFWLVAGAAHVDIHAFARAEYERRVLEFLAPRLLPPFGL